MIRKLFVLATLLTVCAGLLPHSAWAAAVTILSPSPSANLHCTVTVSGTYTLGTNEMIFQGVGVRLDITDKNGNVTSTSTTWGGGSFSYLWDTTQFPNGNVTLSANMAYIGANGQALTATSPSVVVTVQNGYAIASSGGSAKMLQPSAGQAIVGNGQAFNIQSTHTVVWNRYDDCKTYYAAYDFLLQTNYPNTGTYVSVQDQRASYQLPKQLGPCPWSGRCLGTFNADNSGRNAPTTYQNSATTSGQTSDSNGTMIQVGSDANSFTVTTPPP